jgi:hypothetical protein
LDGDTEQKLTKGKFLYVHNSEYKRPHAIKKVLFNMICIK